MTVNRGVSSWTSVLVCRGSSTTTVPCEEPEVEPESSQRANASSSPNAENAKSTAQDIETKPILLSPSSRLPRLAGLTRSEYAGSSRTICASENSAPRSCSSSYSRPRRYNSATEHASAASSSALSRRIGTGVSSADRRRLAVFSSRKASWRSSDGGRRLVPEAEQLLLRLWWRSGLLLLLLLSWY